VKKTAQLIVSLFLAISFCVAQDTVSVIQGTVKKIDKSTKIVVVKSADGTEKPLEYTANASKDIGEATGQGVEKVTVFYTEEAAKKIARFFAA
jgi:hypothetical protein